MAAPQALGPIQAQVRQALEEIRSDSGTANPNAAWHVVEMGFGLGLHFLSTWQAWRALAHRPTRLFYTALGPSWPSAAHWRQTACHWPELQALTDALLPAWQGLLPGAHRLVLNGGLVQLTVCVGEPEKMLRELDLSADCLWVTEPFSQPGQAASAAVPTQPPPLLDAPSRAASPPAQRLLPWSSLARVCRQGTRLLITSNAACPMPDADPAWLGAPWDKLEAHVLDVLERGKSAPAHVVNLGHGVPPETDPEVLTRIVSLVHEASVGALAV